MPKRPRKLRKVGSSKLSTDQLSHLISGYCLDGPLPALGGIDKSGFPMPFYDDLHRRQCWIENRDFILSLEGKTMIPGKEIFFGKWDENDMKVYFKKGDKPAAWHDY